MFDSLLKTAATLGIGLITGAVANEASRRADEKDSSVIEETGGVLRDAVSKMTKPFRKEKDAPTDEELFDEVMSEIFEQQ